MNFIFFWTDILLYILVFSAIAFAYYSRTQVQLALAWHSVFYRPAALACSIVLFAYLIIALLDSIHFELTTSSQIKSLLDLLLGPIGSQSEKTYSAPFALQLYDKEGFYTPEGNFYFEYPRLKYVPADIYSNAQKYWNILMLSIKGLIIASSIWLISLLTLLGLIAGYKRLALSQVVKKLWYDSFPWRTLVFTVLIILMLASVSYCLAEHYHIFGTDEVGQDIFYQNLKSIRTGIVIGTLTTLIMLPFAVILGLMAGYFGGWVDDIIQYVYTTLSSIPGVLLIAAAILSLQIMMANHPDWFSSLESAADMRLLALCLILGITSWTSLCRLIRAETLKLREVDYVQAAYALGVSTPKILFRHVLPNVTYIILISVVLDFSGLVLAEAVLSYVGVGVDPTTLSWGNTINSARLELARDPMVWWPLLSAFVFMFTLVLAANLYADAVRDAFDPRSKKW